MSKILQKKHKKNLTKHHKLIKVLLLFCFVSLACLITALIYYSVFVVPRETAYALNQNEKEALQKEVALNREQNESFNDTLRTNRIHSLIETGLIKSAVPAYSSEADTCTFGGKENGWIVTSRSQVCYLTYMDFFIVDESLDDVTIKLQDKDSIREYFGNPADRKNSSTCSELYIKDERPASLSYISWQTAHDQLDTDCIKTTTGSLDKDIQEKSLARRIIRPINFSEITSSKKYLLIQYTNKYFEHDFGCKKSVLVGCAQLAPYPILGY